MKPYDTTIDTVKLQLDLPTSEQQHYVLTKLIDYVSKYYFVKYTDFVNEMTGQVNRTYYVYYNNTYICSLYSGIYKTYDKNKIPIYTYYISMKLAGLKRYKNDIDNASNDCLLRLCAFLNSNYLIFKITQLDIAIDVYAPFDNVVAVCTKRTPNTNYFSLLEQQIFEQTRYIENIAYEKLNKVSKYAYVYDKAYKEGLTINLTRFELSLKPRFFIKHDVDINIIANALDRYHIMYFPTIQEKQSRIDAYESYPNLRYRDIKKVGFEAYRLYPNLIYINNFLEQMHNINLFDFDDGLKPNNYLK